MKEIFEILKNAEEINCTKVSGVIKKLEDMGARWRNYGDLEANNGRINITSSPVSIFAERITNAIDAIIELEAEKNQQIKSLKTPRKAVEVAFGIPETGLTKILEKQRGDIVNEIGIEVFVRHRNNEINVAFRDKGIGLTRYEMPKTILSLNESNKIRKQYLVGQYGQGGSTTCAHSEYTIIITKKFNSTNVSFTIIRYNELKDDFLMKDGKWEYLVMEDNLPPSISDKEFEQGTMVIHVDYQSNQAQGFINYYELIEQIMFDPPIPFWLYYDKWSEGNRRSLFGARRRLENEKNTQSEEFIIPLDKEDLEKGYVKLRYFLLPSGKKVGEIFSDDRNPIIITYNGQVQGSLPKSTIKERCKLPYLSDFLIIQIDCDNLSPKGTRFVFASTREKIKELAEKYFLKIIVEELSENENLKLENNKREEEFLTSKIEKSDLEMKKRLAEMLNRITPGNLKFVMKIQGEEENDQKRRSNGTNSPSKELPPLPTKTEPTYLKIVNKQVPIEMEINSVSSLKLESDAPDDIFDKNWELEIETIDKIGSQTDKNTNRFNIVSHSLFKGGRSNCKIELREEAKKGQNKVVIGSEIAVKTKLSKEERAIVSNERLIKVVSPREGSKGKETQINAPDIYEVYKESGYYIENKWSPENVAEVVEGSKIVIYVNMENKWLKSALHKLNFTPPRVNKFKKDYLLHIAFHSFIQSDYFNTEVLKLEDEQKYKLKESELDRVARTVLTALSSESGIKE